MDKRNDIIAQPFETPGWKKFVEARRFLHRLPFIKKLFRLGYWSGFADGLKQMEVVIKRSDLTPLKN